MSSTATNVGTVEDLHASAVKACGLDDFGVDDDNYREALGVLLESYRARRRPHRARQQDAAVLRAQRAGGPAGVRGRVEAVPAARRRADRTADLRHRPAPHRHHRAAPAAGRRPAPSGPGAVAGRVPAAPPAARNLVGEPGFPAARCPVHQGARGEPGLHGPALHDRRRGGGVLAAAAPVTALGVLRDAGAPADVLPSGWPSRTGPSPIGGTAATFS